MISICRNHSTNVKNWQSGDMALRWCAAGLVEAGKQFRRVNGHMHLPTRASSTPRIDERAVSGSQREEPDQLVLADIGERPQLLQLILGKHPRRHRSPSRPAPERTNCSGGN